MSYNRTPNNYQRSNSHNPYNNYPPQNNIQRNQTYNRNPNQRNNNLDNFFNDFINKPFFGIDEFSDPFDDVFSGFGFGRNHIQNLIGDMNQQINNMQNNLINVNNQNSRGANKGTMISQAYVSKVDYSSGQPVKESYQSRAIRQVGDDGHRISEKQEAYKNSNGIQKAAHQRLLDDRGAKLIKQRNKNTGEQEEHNIFRGMNEGDLENFNREYNDYRQKVGFEKNYQLLNNMRNNMQRIGAGNNQNNNQPLGLPSAEDFNDMNMDFGNDNFNGNNNYQQRRTPNNNNLQQRRTPNMNQQYNNPNPQYNNPQYNQQYNNPNQQYNNPQYNQQYNNPNQQYNNPQYNQQYNNPNQQYNYPPGRRSPYN
jgi:hypothetical protein